MTKKKTSEQFIKEAKEVHGDFYDYSEAEYQGNKIKIKIICPNHGPFWQKPNDHLKGTGCKECSKNIRVEKRKMTLNEFIEKAKEVHGDYYNYSKIEYINNTTKVQIICPIHGSFWQTPKNHLKGNGCPKCSNQIRKSKLSLTIKEFVQKAKEVHDDHYDYSEVEYINAHQKIKIICPKHGSFWQKPNDHLKGCGCPFCVHHISKGEKEIYEFLKTLLY